MEDQGGGNLIDQGFVVLAVVAGFVEYLVGFVGGEAFVPEMDGHAGELAEFDCELTGFEGARTFLTGKMQRVADHDGDGGVAAGKSGNGAEVVAAIAMNFEGEDRLCGEAELIRDGDADPFGAHVKSEEARGWR